MTEPPVWLPSAIGTMPAATAAAEPDDDPPGVCAGLRGLRVPAGCRVANSVVTVLPSTIPPARRDQRDHRRIRLRPVAGIDRRAVFGRQIGGVENVLDADRQPVAAAAVRARLSARRRAPRRGRVRRTRRSRLSCARSPRRRVRPRRAVTDCRPRSGAQARARRASAPTVQHRRDQSAPGFHDIDAPRHRCFLTISRGAGQRHARSRIFEESLTKLRRILPAMAWGARWYLVCSIGLGVLGVLAGCSGGNVFAEREPWRHDAEVQCLNSGTVKEGPGLVRIRSITGSRYVRGRFSIQGVRARREFAARLHRRSASARRHPGPSGIRARALADQARGGACGPTATALSVPRASGIPVAPGAIAITRRRARSAGIAGAAERERSGERRSGDLRFPAALWRRPGASATRYPAPPDASSPPEDFSPEPYERRPLVDEPATSRDDRLVASRELPLREPPCLRTCRHAANRRRSSRSAPAPVRRPRHSHRYR